jgi:hypothetical protein
MGRSSACASLLLLLALALAAVQGATDGHDKKRKEVRAARPAALLLPRSPSSCRRAVAEPLAPVPAAQISDYITAHTDTLGHLPEALKRKLAKADSRTINETIEEFSSVPLDLVVDVRLVGFDGAG